MNTKQRILKYLEFKGISKSEFYLKTDLSNGYLDKIKNIGADKLEKIISVYPDISLKWLISGVGEMIEKPQYSNPQNIMPDEVQEFRIEYMREMLRMQELQMKQYKELRKKLDEIEMKFKKERKDN